MFKKIMKKATQALMLVPMAALVLSVAAAPTSSAVTDAMCGPNVDVNSSSSSSSTNPLQEGTDCARGSGQNANIVNVFKIVVNVMLFIVGAVAVIMLVIGGLRYVTSNGDQNAVTGAKNTIMYAIIGIVVAFLSFAAVNFVTEQLTAGTVM